MARPRNPNRPRPVRFRAGRESIIYEGWNQRTQTWKPDSPIGQFLNAIKQGAHLQTACLAVGAFHQGTVRDWVSRGVQLLTPDQLEPDEQALTPENTPYAQFAAELSQAEALSELELVSLWRQAARNAPMPTTGKVPNWQAAQALLRARYPERWRAEELALTVTPASTPQQEMARLIASNPDVALAAEQLALAAEQASRHQTVDVEAEEH